MNLIAIVDIQPRSFYRPGWLEQAPVMEHLGLLGVDLWINDQLTFVATSPENAESAAREILGMADGP